MFLRNSKMLNSSLALLSSSDILSRKFLNVENTYGVKSWSTGKQSKRLEIWQINIAADDRWLDLETSNFLCSSQKWLLYTLSEKGITLGQSAWVGLHIACCVSSLDLKNEASCKDHSGKHFTFSAGKKERVRTHVGWCNIWNGNILLLTQSLGCCFTVTTVLLQQMCYKCVIIAKCVSRSSCSAKPAIK